MAASTALSETLKSITLTKIKELEKQRTAYNNRRRSILAAADEQGDGVTVESVTKLYDGVKDRTDVHGANAELNNIGRWLDQARYDPTVPKAKLLAIDADLRARLDIGTRKLDLANLYSSLLTEWIETPASTDSEPADLERSSSDDSFDFVKDTQKARLEQLRDKFARVVFEPLHTDEVEIDQYLEGLFPGDHGAAALKRLRSDMAAHGKRMLSSEFSIDDKSLRWCIKALLKNQLLNDEKKASLRDFLKDEAVLKEIQDVLNMRLRDLKDWEWDLGEEGMPVIPRQSLNGKWRVMMDEDVLQTLLTQCMGTSWAVQVKSALRTTRFHRKLWKQFTLLTEEDSAKWKYFIDASASTKCVAEDRLDIYAQEFFMAPLPNKFFEAAGGYNDEDEVTGDNEKKSPKDIKQLLLRTLATEVLIRRAVDGEAAMVQSDFQWFATGIAHSTVFAVMRFVGFPEEWITFFRKVLEPPLNMLDGGPVRTRKRGLPMAHVLENVLGELVLFFMDLAVAQNDGMILYRFHDDLWLAGKPQQVADSWKTMEEFAKVMGLEFNQHKTGAAYLTTEKRTKDPAISGALPKGDIAMNFLRLDPDSGSWEINQSHVQEHVAQLKKQLDGSKSVLQWIKTWNSCIGRFFSYTFGEPAHCFGKAHIDAILATHTEMQRTLFPHTTVTEHVKSMITAHFPDAPNPLPDAFISMPESLGGLGLKNPFIPLLLLRHDMQLTPSPATQIADFLATERKEYALHKRLFDASPERAKRKHYKSCFPESEDDAAASTPPPLTWEQARAFFSFEAFTAHRELTSSNLHALYKRLLSQPSPSGVEVTAGVRHALRTLPYTPEGLDEEKPERCDWEVAWTVQALEDELMELFGGLEVVDRGLLPVGVLGALKEKRVVWQMVL